MYGGDEEAYDESLIPERGHCYEAAIWKSGAFP